MPSEADIRARIVTEGTTYTDPAQGYWSTPTRPYARGKWIDFPVINGAVPISSADPKVVRCTAQGTIITGVAQLVTLSIIAVGSGGQLTLCDAASPGAATVANTVYTTPTIAAGDVVRFTRGRGSAGLSVSSGLSVAALPIGASFVLSYW
jgi:hypothetical protein